MYSAYLINVTIAWLLPIIFGYNFFKTVAKMATSNFDLEEPCTSSFLLHALPSSLLHIPYIHKILGIQRISLTVRDLSACRKGRCYTGKATPQTAVYTCVVDSNSHAGASQHATGAWSYELINKVTECMPLGDKKARIVSSDIPSVDAWNYLSLE